MSVQAIPHPHGVTVFGSAQLQARPDRAQIELAVTRLAKHPAEAFREAREASANVSGFVARLGIRSADVAMANALLQAEFDGWGEKRTFVGYRASIAYRIFMSNLQQVEPLLVGAVDA